MKQRIFGKWFRQHRDWGHHARTTRRAHRSSASLSSTHTRLRLLRLHDSSRNRSAFSFSPSLAVDRGVSPATSVLPLPSRVWSLINWALIAGSAKESRVQVECACVLRVCVCIESIDAWTWCKNFQIFKSYFLRFMYCFIIIEHYIYWISHAKGKLLNKIRYREN